MAVHAKVSFLHYKYPVTLYSGSSSWGTIVCIWILGYKEKCTCALNFGLYYVHFLKFVILFMNEYWHTYNHFLIMFYLIHSSWWNYNEIGWIRSNCSICHTEAEVPESGTRWNCWIWGHNCSQSTTRGIVNNQINKLNVTLTACRRLVSQKTYHHLCCTRHHYWLATPLWLTNHKQAYI